MKKIIYMFLATAILATSAPIFAKGGVHYVRPYVKKSGKFVRGHLSGNHRSHVHCRKNVCR